MAETEKKVIDYPFSTKKEAPAIGMSIVMNIPGERQITLQSFVAQEDGLKAQNDLLDRMNLLAERQRAKYLVKDFEAELATKKDEIKFRLADRQRQEEAHAKKLAEHNAKIGEFKAAAENAKKEGYEIHVNSNRKGPYEPRGHVLTRINACNAGVHNEEEQIKKVEADFNLWLQSNQTSIDNANSKIEELRSAIRHCEQQINQTASEDDGA